LKELWIAIAVFIANIQIIYLTAELQLDSPSIGNEAWSCLKKYSSIFFEAMVGSNLEQVNGFAQERISAVSEVILLLNTNSNLCVLQKLIFVS
jgi:hypothetical protein